MDSKPWYQSKGVLGGITAGVPSVVILLKIAGIDIADLADNLIAGLLGSLGLIGALFAIVGRVKAKYAPVITAGKNSPLRIVIIFAVFSFGLTGCGQLTAFYKKPSTQVEVTHYSDVAKAELARLQSWAASQAVSFIADWFSHAGAAPGVSPEDRFVAQKHAAAAKRAPHLSSADVDATLRAQYRAQAKSSPQDESVRLAD